MSVLLINQSFYPDAVSTAQHLADLALELRNRGEDVTVLCSRRAYDTPSVCYPKFEIWQGIKIVRIPNSGFGKASKWRRALDFGSFIFFAIFKLLLLGRFDTVVALTSPPIISFIASLYAVITKARFVYWVMDLNPDEAIAAGWLREQSIITRFLERCSKFSLSKADSVVVLDRYMQARILAKGVDPEKVAIVPPWSHDSHICFSSQGRDAFRSMYNLENSFVVMYAGNHSPCHPLDALISAANALLERKDIVFCFMGGGSEHRKIKVALDDGSLKANIVCLPYQKLTELAGALSAADLHIVVMGEKLVGTVHPCKIYNILQVNSPVLTIGPKESHLQDVLHQLLPSEHIYLAMHGESQVISKMILDAASKVPRTRPSFEGLAARFSAHNLLPKLCDLVLGQTMHSAKPAGPEDRLPANEIFPQTRL